MMRGKLNLSSVYKKTGRCFLLFMLLTAFAPKVSAQDTYGISWTGTDPATAAASNDESENTGYLYNVGKGMFLDMGGNWGVECMLSNDGTLYKITSSGNGYVFSQTQGSNTVYIYPTYLNGGNTYLKYFLAADTRSCAFTMAKPSDESKGYRISFSGDSYKFYMVGKDVDGTTAGAPSAKRICQYLETELTNVTDNSDLWIFVSLKECEEKIKNSAKASKTTFEELDVPCTRYIKDHDFARNHVNVGSWVGTTTSGTEAMVNNQGAMSVPSASSTPTCTYYIGNGYGVDANEQSANGGKWTANIFGNGTMKQTISNLPIIGWYRVTAYVGTNSTAGSVKLFAQAGTEDTASGYASHNTSSYVLSETTSFVDAEELVNETSNMLTAKVFVGYDNDGNIKSLTFGVTVSDAQTYDWTCFDNFELTYLGALRNKVILDEDKEEIDYMNTQNNAIAQSGQSTIFLHRTLNAGKWNSIVLPFSITSSVIKQVFGSDTKICELAGATDENNPYTIHFTDCTSDGIQAGNLYIIKPVTTTFNSSGHDVESSALSGTTLAAGTYYALDGKYGQTDQDGQTKEYVANITGNYGQEVYNTDGKVTFKGTYIKQSGIIPVNSYYLSGDKWKYNTKSASSAKGFRGWLETSKEDSSAKYSVAINGVMAMDDETTGIMDSMSINEKSFDVYDLGGRLVMKNAKSLDSLTPGCYVVNGRKVVK